LKLGGRWAYMNRWCMERQTKQGEPRLKQGPFCGARKTFCLRPESAKKSPFAEHGNKGSFSRARKKTKSPFAGHSNTEPFGRARNKCKQEAFRRTQHNIRIPLGSGNSREPCRFPPCLISALNIVAYIPSKRCHHTTSQQCVS
jgi:hypothetical protein